MLDINFLLVLDSNIMTFLSKNLFLLDETSETKWPAVWRLCTITYCNCMPRSRMLCLMRKIVFLVLLKLLTLFEYETCLVKHQHFVLLAKINEWNYANHLASLYLSNAPFNLLGFCTLGPLLTSQNGFVFFYLNTNLNYFSLLLFWRQDLNRSSECNI